MELREKIAELVYLTIGGGQIEQDDALDTADEILAIPEIRDALAALAVERHKNTLPDIN